MQFCPSYSAVVARVYHAVIIIIRYNSLLKHQDSKSACQICSLSTSQKTNSLTSSVCKTNAVHSKFIEFFLSGLFFKNIPTVTFTHKSIDIFNSIRQKVYQKVVFLFFNSEKCNALCNYIAFQEKTILLFLNFLNFDNTINDISVANNIFLTNK